LTGTLGQVTITEKMVEIPILVKPLTAKNLEKEGMGTTGEEDRNIIPYKVGPIDFMKVDVRPKHRPTASSSKDTRRELRLITEPPHSSDNQSARYKGSSASSKPSHHRKRDDLSAAYLEAPPSKLTKHRKSRRPHDDSQPLSQPAHPRHAPDQPSRLARTTSPVPKFWQNAQREREMSEDPYISPNEYGYGALSPRYQGSVSYEAALAAHRSRRSASGEPGYQTMSNRQVPASTARQSSMGARKRPNSLSSLANQYSPRVCVGVSTPVSICKWLLAGRILGQLIPSLPMIDILSQAVGSHMFLVAPCLTGICSLRTTSPGIHLCRPMNQKMKVIGYIADWMNR
jgi:hypothetical protein